MRRLTTLTTIAAIAWTVLVTAAGGVVAAEPCRKVEGRIDPAFAAPGDCIRPAPAKPAASADGWTTAPDGTRRWTKGDTSISVSGSVGFDLRTGNAQGSPNR